VSVELDDDAKLAEYAHPERLVTTEWLAKRLGSPGLVVLESDEEDLPYVTGHIPGAVKIDWFTELNDQVTRDYMDGGRTAWIAEARDLTTDVPTPARTDYPQEGALRGGHIPGAASVPWARAAADAVRVPITTGEERGQVPAR
jgi:3-mercaptopyruvate sulfurtransferase SseA